jgi:hypothetical protein
LPSADPAAPSSVHQQNALHKLAFARISQPTMEKVLDQVPPARLGQAAIAKDVDGNTPIHLANYELGFAEGETEIYNVDSPNYQQASTKKGRANFLLEKLTEAASANGNPANAIENNARETPQRTRERGKEKSLELHRADVFANYFR